MSKSHNAAGRHTTGAVCRVQPSRHDHSIVKFGRNLQRDPKARWRMFQIDEAKGKPELMVDAAIPTSGRVRLRELDPNRHYLVFAEGYETAGVVTTAELALKPPFFLTLDAPKIDRKAFEKAKAEFEARQKAEEAGKKAARPMMSRITRAVRGALRGL